MSKTTPGGSRRGEKVFGTFGGPWETDTNDISLSTKEDTERVTPPKENSTSK